MIGAVISEWKRLILPPEDVAVRVFEQTEDGRGLVEVDAARVLWKKHLSGFSTFALDPSWHDPVMGRTLTRASVISLPGTGDEALAAADALLRPARDLNLAIALQWGAAGQVRLWLVAEPVPQETLQAMVRRLVQAMPGAEELSGPLLLAPGWDRRAGGWTYFFKPGERPTAVDSEVLPAGLLDYQIDVLSGITPTPASRLAGGGTSQPTPGEGAAVPSVRACEVLSDPGQPVRLMVQRADGAWEMVRLDAPAALDLARDLIEATRRQLIPINR